ncbi:inactive pancreatic lipase-related protein 1 isoform X2 [Monomorium pharaonis]|uniref:inactive pancreatic lipase-related protein 1 isoform X2 n=1 Tax=Monomorium pharaonis TaxID=307658 RepID=UPI001746064A|nr:inactive pancreatic lipase-related protein 1 isoform X2 [Monomorium pharaonis]
MVRTPQYKSHFFLRKTAIHLKSSKYYLLKMLTLFVYSYGLLFFISRTVSGQIDSCSCISPDLEFATGVNLLYYKCDNEPSGRISYNITAPEAMLNVLNPDKRTIFFIFGYLLYPDHPLTQYIMKALCDGQSDNVVLLDWSKYSNGSYETVFENAQKVGVLFAESILKLKNANLNVSKIYIIGFSIGAHIAGIAGKCNKDFKISRITGLDPANRYIPVLSMSQSLSGCYLTPDAAKCVDVIHTDMGYYGTTSSSMLPLLPHTGTVEFYANGGYRPQPNCTLFAQPLSFEEPEIIISRQELSLTISKYLL